MNLATSAFAIVDIETTGPAPGVDRIVEVCVYRVGPGEAPRRVFDSLVNPHRQVSGRSGEMDSAAMHGITADEARRGPSFEHVARRLYESMQGAVVVAHNAPFDLGFLAAEFRSLGVEFHPPSLCTMALAGLLGIGEPGASLLTLCRSLCIPLVESGHQARVDAQAAALAFMMLRQQMILRGLGTTEALEAVGSVAAARCIEGLSRPLLTEIPASMIDSERPLMPRTLSAAQRRAFDAEAEYLRRFAPDEVVVREQGYARALGEAVASYQISKQQFDRLVALRDASGMTAAEIRAVHAKVFAAVLGEFLTDSVLDEDERQRLVLLYECLSQLGWAPGQ
jgi:DNA polymerase III epsilon subunit-like protein